MKKTISHISSNYSNSFYFIVLSLSVGALIYVLLRPSEPQFFALFSEIGIGNPVNTLRQNTLPFKTLLPSWMIFSLPNGLWAFAYSLLITGIWSGSKSRIKYFWLTTVPVLVLGFEVLQYAEIIRGTFCMEDISFGLAGIIIGNLVGNKVTKTKYYEKKTT